MSQADAEPELDAAGRQWIASALWNFGLAEEAAPPSVATAFQGAAWADMLSSASLDLPYEPRSLATSPDARRVAVGTKSGTVHVAQWDQASATWFMRDLLKGPSVATMLSGLGEEPAERHAERHAIRGLTFLGNDTLVAGRGAGRFLVFDLCEAIAEPIKPSAIQGGWTYPATPLPLARFVGVVPLFPREEPPLDQVAAVGTCRGPTVRILVRQADGWKQREALASEVFPNLPPAARVVDAVWAHGRLWVLEASGHIYRYRPGSGARAAPPLAPLELDVEHAQEGPAQVFLPGGDGSEERWSRSAAYDLCYPKRGIECRALVGCVMGLGVQIADDFSFLRFDSSEDRGAVPRVRPSTARWLEVKEALGFTLAMPFYESRTPASQDIDSRNPVWMVIASTRRGLHWVSWPESRGRAIARLPEVPAPRAAGCDGSSVVRVTFGLAAGVGPTFLVCGTRDHKLRITSLVNVPPARTKLRLQLEAGAEAMGPGAAWQRVATLLNEDFANGGDRSPAVAAPEAADLLRSLDAAHLRRLVPRVVRRWSRASAAAPKQDEARVRALEAWILALVRRGHELDASLARELSGIASDLIAEMREGDPERTDAELAPFAYFLRKWCVEGHTFGEKQDRLIDLVAWNTHCGRDLDALTYLTRLLRRRVDTLWSAQQVPDPTSGAGWDLVESSNKKFSVHSWSDGRIAATDRHGSAIPWQVEETLSRSSRSEHALDIQPGGIRHALADEFFDTFWQGPYARRLLLCALPEPGRHLLLFGLRGWRRAAAKRSRAKPGDPRRPRLHALILEERQDDDGLQLAVISTHSLPLESELYAMHRLELSSAGRKGATIHVVAGTRGTWPLNPDRWRPCPFVEIEIGLGEEGDGSAPTLKVRPARVSTRDQGERSMLLGETSLPETAHSPCWSLVVGSGSGASGHPWLCAGSHDGWIRPFLRSSGAAPDADIEEVVWQELDVLVPSLIVPGEAAEEGIPPSALRTASPVWCMHEPKPGLLAYGCADGVVGVVEWAGGGPTPGWRHLLHVRESAPIAGLGHYRDAERGTVCLVVLNQDGVVTLFELDPAPVDPSSSRPVFQGMRLDRFSIWHSARSLVVTSDADAPHGGLPLPDGMLPQGPPPSLLIGTADGFVHRHVLALARPSARRRWCASHLSQWLITGERGVEKPNPEAVSDSIRRMLRGGHVLQWLRVIDVGGVHLLRFSMWHELRAACRLVSASPDSPGVSSCIQLIERLADEAYRRRPFEKETVKVLWEEGAKLANALAVRAVETLDAKERKDLLRWYLKLSQAIDGLCNRWLQQTERIESAVLVHSFDSLFHWADAVLILWAHPPQRAWRIRRFMLHKVVQRRLNYTDEVVPLETLRLINRSLIWTLARVRRHHDPAPDAQSPWHFGLRASMQPSGIGFYDLMTMVGDVARRRVGSLRQNDPLWSQLERFFACCLLLVPDSVLVIGHVIGESLLAESRNDIVSGVLREAHALMELYERRTPEVEDGLTAFKDYYDPVLDLRLGYSANPAEPPEDTPTSRLLDRAARALTSPERVRAEDKTMVVSHHYRDHALLQEHKHVLRSAAWASWLHRPEPDEGPEADALAWVRSDSSLRFFGHSRVFLRELLQTRTELLEILESHGPDALGVARELCLRAEHRARSGADLFEPQRSQFVAVVSNWRAGLESWTTSAAEMLQVLDRFNRHVYRASADGLLAIVTELAMRVSPVWLGDLERGQTLQSAIESRLTRMPLYHRIFARGTRLVESTHLAGTLLSVARSHLRHPEAPRAVEGSKLDSSTIQEELRDACRRTGLLCKVETLHGPVTTAPGSRALWSAVLYELATNVRRYGSAPDNPALFGRWILSGAERQHLTLVVHGSRPFRDSLPLDDATPPAGQDQLAHLRELLRSTVEPGERLAAVTGGGEALARGEASGMGLALVAQICRWVGMRARPLLFGSAAPDSALESAPEAAGGWPLAVAISWDPEP